MLIFTHVSDGLVGGGGAGGWAVGVGSHRGGEESEGGCAAPGCQPQLTVANGNRGAARHKDSASPLK